MRPRLLAAALLVGLGLPSTALAQQAAKSDHSFSGNVTLASEYLYRGIAQTRGKPALQGGFDYGHASGFYLGTWASNVSWISDATAGASASLEIDVYGGFKGSVAGDLGFDLGILTYNYPGRGKPAGAAKPDTTELYGALSYKWFSLKYSRSTGSLFGWVTTAGGKTSGSGYLDLTGTWELGSGFGLAAHIGRQKVKGFSPASYTDWKIGVTKDLGFGTLGLAISDTNARANCSAPGGAEPYCFVHHSSATNTYDAGKGRLVVTFGKTF